MGKQEDAVMLVAVVGILLVGFAFYTQIQTWFQSLTTDQNAGVIGGLVIVGVLAFIAIRSKLKD